MIFHLFPGGFNSVTDLIQLFVGLPGFASLVGSRPGHVTLVFFWRVCHTDPFPFLRLLCEAVLVCVGLCWSVLVCPPHKLSVCDLVSPFYFEDVSETFLTEGLD